MLVHLLPNCEDNLGEKETDKKLNQLMGWATVKSEYEKEKNMKLVKHRPWLKPVLGTMSPAGILGSKAESCVVLAGTVWGPGTSLTDAMAASQRLEGLAT